LRPVDDFLAIAPAPFVRHDTSYGSCCLLRQTLTGRSAPKWMARYSDNLLADAY